MGATPAHTLPLVLPMSFAVTSGPGSGSIPLPNLLHFRYFPARGCSGSRGQGQDPGASPLEVLCSGPSGPGQTGTRWAGLGVQVLPYSHPADGKGGTPPPMGAPGKGTLCAPLLGQAGPRPPSPWPCPGPSQLASPVGCSESAGVCAPSCPRGAPSLSGGSGAPAPHLACAAIPVLNVLVSAGTLHRL